MNQARKPLFERLKNDTGAGSLAALAPGGIHYGKAPQKATFPYVLFQKQTGVPSYTFDAAPATESQLWQVKAVALDTAAASGQEQAETIDARINALLNNHELALPGGHKCLNLRREIDLDYRVEREGGGYEYHVGALWRVETS